MRARWARIAVAAAVVTSGAPLAAGSAAPQRPASATVGVIDTGINPYHEEFRDRSPQARRHPSTYLPGFPKTAQALSITLDSKDYWEAVQADCKKVWLKVKPGQLYWFPGTKIVGAISFQQSFAALNCGSAKPRGMPILDAGGHGTMTGSRATGSKYGACPACRVVAIQFSGSATNAQDALDSVKWATANAGWLDVQSNSWGPFVPGWVPTSAGNQLFTGTSELVRTAEASGRAHLSFWASGNGAAFRLGAVGHPTLLTPHLTPSVLSIGGMDSGQVNTWAGFPPHVVSDSCDSWAAQHQNTRTGEGDARVGGGTSAATPFVAGGAAAVLAEARRLLGDSRTGVRSGVVAVGRKGAVASGPLSDGTFTLEEWRAVMLATATRRPVRQYEDGPPCEPTSATYSPTPIQWQQVPDSYPEYVNIGYGAVDRPSLKLAKEVLAGKAPMPDRAAMDQYFRYDRQAREATYQVWSTG
ncbi:MAG TPA: S8 family serine peptidase [Mycobacteriales bacterium]|nr:S8 family serine peptidase [Mycobacteriales bacterium]